MTLSCLNRWNRRKKQVDGNSQWRTGPSAHRPVAGGPPSKSCKRAPFCWKRAPFTKIYYDWICELHVYKFRSEIKFRSGIRFEENNSPSNQQSETNNISYYRYPQHVSNKSTQTLAKSLKHILWKNEWLADTVISIKESLNGGTCGAISMVSDFHYVLWDHWSTDSITDYYCSPARKANSLIRLSTLIFIVHILGNNCANLFSCLSQQPT